MGSMTKAQASEQLRATREAIQVRNDLRAAIKEADKRLPMVGCLYSSPTMGYIKSVHRPAYAEVKNLMYRLRKLYDLKAHQSEYYPNAEELGVLIKYIEACERKLDHRDLREDNTFIPLGKSALERKKILVCHEEDPYMVAKEMDVLVY